MGKTALGTFALLILLGAGGIPAEEALEIHIRSTYFGHSGTESELTVSCEGQRCLVDGEAVEWAAVERLLQAVERPVLELPTAKGLGISAEWLAENAEEAWKELPLFDEVPTPGQKEFFAASFKDPKALQAGLMKHFDFPPPLHDRPGVFVEIRQAGGAKVELRSTSSSIYLMPWEVTKGGAKATTYDRAVSDAVVQLMPEGFLNRARLVDPDLREKLALGLWYSHLPEWLRIGAEDRLGRSLDVVRQRYTITQSSFVPFRQGEKKVENWEAVLQGAHLPPAVSILVILPVEGDRLVALDQTLERLERAAALPLSLPWFRAALTKNPHTKVVIRFDKDRSLDPRSLEMFIEAMNEEGDEQEALAEEVHRAAAEVTLLNVNVGEGEWSRWIVLPDRRMILWDYHGEQVLDWTLPKCPRSCRVGRAVGLDGGLVVRRSPGSQENLRR